MFAPSPKPTDTHGPCGLALCGLVSHQQRGMQPPGWITTMKLFSMARAAALTAAILTLTACGGSETGPAGGEAPVSTADAVSLPAAAVGEDTFAGVYLDFASMAPADVKAAMLDAMNRVTAEMPDGQKPDPAEASSSIDDALADFTSSHATLTSGGGRGVLILMSAQVGDGKPKKTVLLHKDASADGEPLVAAVASMRDGVSLTSAAVNDTWLHLTDDKGEFAPLPATGSDAAAGQLGGLLNARPGGARFAVRMTGALREEMGKKIPAPEAADAMNKLKEMTDAAGSLNFGSNPALGVRLGFASPEAAEATRSALSDLLTGAKVKFNAQMAQMPGDGPSPETIDALFASLEPAAAAESLDFNLGAPTLDALGGLAPAMGPMVGMMMMGMMGGK